MKKEGGKKRPREKKGRERVQGGGIGGGRGVRWGKRKEESVGEKTRGKTQQTGG